MKKKLLLKLLLVINLITLPFCSFAWHANGHSTAGAIAYYYLLEKDPATLAKVLATLKQFYWYNTSHWQNQLSTLPADKQDVGLFMLASTYPDDAKSDLGNPDGDPQHRMWHYMDFPYVKPGSTVTGLPPKNPNAQLQISSLIASIPGESDSPQKAKDLAWLFHLIEDIHQPLHCAELYDDDFKNGDTGGNDVMVTKNKMKNLHWTWDDLVGGGDHDFVNWPNVGYSLYHSPKYTLANLTELQTNTTLLSWMQKESYADAVQYAYVNGTISSPDVNNPSVLSPAYKAQASAVAERRVVLAGIRLAQTLQKLYGSSAALVKKPKHS